MIPPPSFGDTTAEYVALHRSVALVEGRFNAVRVHGPDTVSFLDSILSQDVAAMANGSVARSFLLQPQGKLTATLWVLRGEDEAYLLADPGFGVVTQAELQRYLLRVKVTIEPVDESISTLIGPDAAAEMVKRGLPAVEGWTHAADAVVARVPLVEGVDRFVVIGDVDWTGVTKAGSIAADALRVEAGEPVMGVDIDEKTIPQESGLVPASVSFTKGCYLGQELVARIDSRGRVNRRLVAVHVAENVVPPSGAEIVAGEKVVGVMTSPTESLDLRAPVGLALIRREVADGDRVAVRWEGGEVGAVVTPLPTSVFTES